MRVSASSTMLGSRFSVPLLDKWTYEDRIGTISIILKFMETRENEWNTKPIKIVANCIKSEAIIEDGSIHDSMDIELKLIINEDNDDVFDDALLDRFEFITALLARVIKQDINSTALFESGTKFFRIADINRPITVIGHTDDLMKDYQKYVCDMYQIKFDQMKIKGGDSK